MDCEFDTNLDGLSENDPVRILTEFRLNFSRLFEEYQSKIFGISNQIKNYSIIRMILDKCGGNRSQIFDASDIYSQMVELTKNTTKRLSADFFKHLVKHIEITVFSAEIGWSMHEFEKFLTDCGLCEFVGRRLSK